MFHVLRYAVLNTSAFPLIIFILQLGSLSSGSVSTGSSWLPPSSINFQSFNENSDLASSERGFLGSAPTFVPGSSSSTHSAGGAAGAAARTGRGAKVGTGASLTRPSYLHPDGGTKSQSAAATSAQAAAAAVSSHSAPAAAARSNRRGRGGKGSEGPSA